MCFGSCFRTLAEFLSQIFFFFFFFWWGVGWLVGFTVRARARVCVFEVGGFPSYLKSVS